MPRLNAGNILLALRRLTGTGLDDWSDGTSRSRRPSRRYHGS
jgi:hypothetical protein